MKILKYILSLVLLINGILLFLSVTGITTSLLVITTGLLILPPISNTLKNKIKFWNKKNLRYPIIIFVFLLSLFFSKETDKHKTPQIKSSNKEISENDNPVKNKIDINNIDWKKGFSKTDILGEWYQLAWYSNSNPKGWSNNDFKDGEYFFNGDSEQKKLILTKTTYQTFYTPFDNSNANPLMFYTLRNGKMKVTLKAKVNTSVFDYLIRTNKDNTYLFLKDNDITKIYTKYNSNSSNENIIKFDSKNNKLSK